MNFTDYYSDFTTNISLFFRLVGYRQYYWVKKIAYCGDLICCIFFLRKGRKMIATDQYPMTARSTFPLPKNEAIIYNLLHCKGKEVN